MDRYDQPTEPRIPPRQNMPLDASTPNAGGQLPPSEQVFPYSEPTQELTQAVPYPSGQPVAQPGYVGPQVQRQQTMARRRFTKNVLAGTLAAGGAVAVGGGVVLAEWLRQRPGSTSGIQGAANNVQVGHLLRRAGFGATASELQNYSNMGFEGAVNHLLNYQQVNDSAMEQRLQSLNFDLNTPRDQQRWWLLRMAWTQRPLLEKMTLFWSGVFTSSFRKVGGPKVSQRMIVQNNFLRAHAFDTFDALLLGITADPAMLFYLDLTKSTRLQPNENYARELMELFTVGLANYNQQDVTSGAKALAGWHVRGLSSYYNAAQQNTTSLQFMGQTGTFNYKDILRILADHPATPWFIGRRLFAFFAYENPSTDDLKPLVDAYTQSGHNMGAVMRALLLSPQFLSDKAYRGRIKSPTEFIAGAYRALGLTGNGMGLPAISTLMGQPLFDPPNVAGWPGDLSSSNWLNSGSWMTRLNYLDALLVRGSAKGQTTAPQIDLQEIVTTNHLATPEQFVDHFSSFLLDGMLPDERRSQVLDYFTATGNASPRKITLTGGQAYPLNRVRGALYLLMASPEYQLN